MPRRRLLKKINIGATAIIGLLSIFQASSAFATDAYLEASQNACNHLKNCAKKNMGEIPPEYQAMVEQSLETMCQALPSSASIPGFDSSHKYYKPAIACMDSISKLSCKHIDDSGTSTPECEKLGNMN